MIQLIYLILIFLLPFFPQQVFPVFSGGIYFFLTLLFLIFSFNAIKNKSSVVNELSDKRGLLVSAILLLISFLLSSVLSNARIFSLRSSESVAIGIFIMFLTYGYFSSSSDKKEAADNLVLVLLFQGCMLCVYGLREYFYFFDTAKEYIVSTDAAHQFKLYAHSVFSRKRVLSMFLSPNLFAGYLITLFPLSFYFLTKHAGNSSKRYAAKVILSCFFIILFLINIILTKSVGAILSMIFAGIFYCSIVFGKLRPAQKIGVVLCVLFFVTAVSLIVIGRSDDFFGNFSQDNSVLQRINYWKASLLMIKDNFSFGVGSGNFQFFYPRYKVLSANETRYAHNIFLQVFAENGAAGIVFILMLYASLIVYILRLFRLPANGIRFSYLGGIGVLVFLLHNMVSYSFFCIETSFLFWLFVGIFLSVPGVVGSRVKLGSKTVSIVLVGLTVISLFTGFDILMRSLSDFFFYKSMRAAEKRTEYFQKAVKYNPYSPRYYIWIANEKADTEPLQAVKYLIKAADLIPSYYKIYEDISLIFVRIGRNKEARAYIEIARMLYPSNRKIEEIASGID